MNKRQVDGGGGSGGDALAGYEYQIDVSVWLALDLILANRSTQELFLEPASQEDIEAELEENEPGRVTSTTPLDGYQLVVQAKLRGGDAWTVKDLLSLLKYGSEKRKSAVKRLEDPKVRYLLITSAALNGKTRQLQVRHAGVWPKPANMPATIVNALPTDTAGRVAVIGNQDEERLSNDIKCLLTENFRVPNARWYNCWRVLREEVRIRINRGGSGRWNRIELERVIKDNEGYIASSPELEHFVHPINWDNLLSAMRGRHAALIIGQSGTGKTMATRKLYDELREEIPGLSRIPITLGPQQLREDRTEPPVLYDIEDPWGRFDFDPRSRPWNDQLAQFFSHATHDRMVVATSRLDVATSTGALKLVKPWMFALEAEHYGKSERHRIYTTRIPDLPRELQILASEAEKIVLAELGTPLEIQKFFDALPMIERQSLKNPSKVISEAIKLAHQNSIERTVIDQIEARGEVCAATIVWALLKANHKISLRVLRIIEDELAEKEAALREGVSPLIAFFVAARNLRQIENTITYYHPRVEAGIEQTLERHRTVARITLRLLIEILTDPDGPGEEWGTATSAKILAVADVKTNIKPVPEAATQEKIDKWLMTKIAEGGSKFEANLQLAASAGSTKNNVSEVARYFLHRLDKSFLGCNCWKPPEHNEAWYQRMRNDPAIKPMVETFIWEVLPNTSDDYPKSFATKIQKLAPSLSGAFLEAASRAVHFGYIPTADAIAEGALVDLDGFETIVDTAVKVLTPSDEERQQNLEMRLAIVNGEYSEGYAEYLAENDDGYTASEFLKAYVDRVRCNGNWRHFIQHRHYDRLKYYWLKALAKETEDAAPDFEEVAGAFTACRGSEDEAVIWLILLRAWEPSYLEAMTERLIEGHQSIDVRRAALTCLVEHVPVKLAEISCKLISQGGQSRLVEIAIDLAYLRKQRGDDGKRHGLAATAALSSLPEPYIELSEVDLALSKNITPVLSRNARDILDSIKDGSEDIRLLRVLLDAHVSLLHVDDDIRWLLNNSNDNDVAVEALNAAIRREMLAEVEASLNHKFAQVSARALTAIATPKPAPLEQRFLSMVEAKGSPIRNALVHLLDSKPHMAHLATLTKLLKDTWSRSAAQYGEPDDFPIARAAVTAIAKLASFEPGQAEELYGVAIKTSDTKLKFMLFELIARKGGSTYQERLFELAINPGRLSVREAASRALLSADKEVKPEVVAQITPELLATRDENVAVTLTLLLALRAEIEVVRRAAEVLSTNTNRRVLLVLMIWLMSDRDAALAKTIARLLPAKHPGVVWALGGESDVMDESILADLGKPLICSKVYHFMKPK